MRRACIYNFIHAVHRAEEANIFSRGSCLLQRSKYNLAHPSRSQGHNTCNKDECDNNKLLCLNSFTLLFILYRAALLLKCVITPICAHPKLHAASVCNIVYMWVSPTSLSVSRAAIFPNISSYIQTCVQDNALESVQAGVLPNASCLSLRIPSSTATRPPPRILSRTTFIPSLALPS